MLISIFFWTTFLQTGIQTSVQTGMQTGVQTGVQTGKSYVKGISDILQKLRNLAGVPGNAILVSADVIALYPRIPHEDGLKYLFERLEKR